MESNLHNLLSRVHEFVPEDVLLNAAPDSLFSRHIFSAQEEFRRSWSYAIPSREAIERLVLLSPIVEIGAGAGLWAACLKAAGATIYAYDNFSWRKAVALGKHWRVRQGGPLMVRRHPGATLMLCWAPYDDSMAVRALKHYAKTDGKRLIWIGEDEGGCCGGDDFWKLLRKLNFQEVDFIRIPQWPGLHDHVVIYERE